MKRVTVTEWQSENGDALIRQKAPDNYYCSVGSADYKTLVELREAITDIMNQQQNRVGLSPVETNRI